jgi:hypothetical protein
VASCIQLGERPDRYETIGIVLIIGDLFALAGQQLLAERRAKSEKILDVPAVVLAGGLGGDS